MKSQLIYEITLVGKKKKKNTYRVQKKYSKWKLPTVKHTLDITLHMTLRGYLKQFKLVSLLIYHA